MFQLNRLPDWEDPVWMRGPAPWAAQSAQISMPIMVLVIMMKVTLNGICNLSGDTINVGAKIARNTKKLTSEEVSTCAPKGRVFLMPTNLGPIKAPGIIFTDWPPQYAWIPNQMLAVIMRFNTGQNPPLIPHELLDSTVNPMYLWLPIHPAATASMPVIRATPTITPIAWPTDRPKANRLEPEVHAVVLMPVIIQYPAKPCQVHVRRS